MRETTWVSVPRTRGKTLEGWAAEGYPLGSKLLTPLVPVNGLCRRVKQRFFKGRKESLGVPQTPKHLCTVKEAELDFGKGRAGI